MFIMKEIYTHSFVEDGKVTNSIKEAYIRREIAWDSPTSSRVVVNKVLDLALATMFDDSDSWLEAWKPGLVMVEAEPDSEGLASVVVPYLYYE